MKCWVLTRFDEANDSDLYWCGFKGWTRTATDAVRYDTKPKVIHKNLRPCQAVRAQFPN